MTEVWQSRVDTALEPYAGDDAFVVEGKVAAAISIFRESEDKGVGIVSGLWSAQPSVLRTVFQGHETIHVLEGRAVVQAGEQRVELSPGVIASFAPGTPATWTILEPYKQFFVLVTVGASR